RLAAAQDEADEQRESDEQGETLGRDEEGDHDDRRPDTKADENGSPRAEPRGDPTEQHRTAESHELDEEEHAEDGRLRELQLLDPAHAGVADDGLDSVVVEEERQKKEQRLGE